jgi:hypothetical protein
MGPDCGRMDRRAANLANSFAALRPTIAEPLRLPPQGIEAFAKTLSPRLKDREDVDERPGRRIT